MDKDRVKGVVDDAAGRVKRQVGEWTNDPDKQIEGAGQQIKGKAEKAWGNVKDTAREADAHNRHGQEHPRHTGPSDVDRSEHQGTTHESGGR